MNPNDFKKLLDESLKPLKKDLKEVREEIAASEKRIVKDIVDFVSDHLIPIIDEKADKTDMDRVERKLDLYIDKTIVLKSRVDDIESLPTVAHELTVRKNKKSQ